MKRSFLAVLASLLLSAPALAQEAANAARLFSVKSADSSLSYHLIHKLHEVVGTARPTEGKARLLPDGTLQVAVRAQRGRLRLGQRQPRRPHEGGHRGRRSSPPSSSRAWPAA